MSNIILREIHRLRKFIRDLNSEIERGPRVMKAHQTKLANQEKAVKEAKEDLIKRKAAVRDLENRLRASSDLLVRHQQQLDTLTAPNQVEAKEHDIANTKAIIAQLEDEILTALTEIDERTKQIPELEKQWADGQAQFATYQKEAAIRFESLQVELTQATQNLAQIEASLPAEARSLLTRLVKAYGADALAHAEKGVCSQCHTQLPQQMILDLNSGKLICCHSCGRLLYA